MLGSKDYLDSVEPGFWIPFNLRCEHFSGSADFLPPCVRVTAHSAE
jgi:hypothetical protein